MGRVPADHRPTGPTPTAAAPSRPLREYRWTDIARPTHANEVVLVDCTQELHAPSDLRVNRAGMQDIGALGALAVGEAVAEVVDVTERLARLCLNDGFELLKE